MRLGLVDRLGAELDDRVGAELDDRVGAGLDDRVGAELVDRVGLAPLELRKRLARLELGDRPGRREVPGLELLRVALGLRGRLDVGEGLEPDDHLLRRQRLRQQVALRVVAAEHRELVVGLDGLDALGHHLEVEVVPEVDRRLHDRRVARVLRHVHDERLVDLDGVDRQLLEVGERRVAGPEVVDREADAHLRQAVQDRGGAPVVGHDRRLGDLELERTGR